MKKIYIKISSILVIGVLCMIITGSLLFADPANTLLQSAIFQEESLGNLDKAIDLYTEIISSSETQRPYISQAKYRLGMCYVKKGDTKAAEQLFFDIISNYSDQKNWVQKAEHRLKEIKVDTHSLKLLPPPWEDGEIIQLKVELLSGIKVGGVFASIHSDRVSNEPVWKVKTMIIVPGEIEQISSSTLRFDNFLPISSETNDGRGVVKSTFSPHHIKIHTLHKGREINREIELNNVTYDDGQLVYLIRRLPLMEGYKVILSQYSPEYTSLNKVEISVESVEEIDSFMGKQECYKIKIDTFHLLEDKGEGEDFLWLTTDKKRYPLKYIIDDTMVVMTDYRIAKGNAPIAHDDTKNKFSVSIPYDWNILDLDWSDEYKFLLLLVSPDAKLDAYIVGTSMVQAKVSISSAIEIAQSDLKSIKKIIKDYEVISSNGEIDEFDLCGQKAARFTAEYTDDYGVEMIDSRLYVPYNGVIYWMIINGHKDEYYAHETDVNYIYKSFLLKK